MKTSTIEVGELVSTLSAAGVQRQLSTLPGVYPFTLSPEVAALSMSGSSAVVAINALMLKRTKLAGIKRVGSPGATTAAASVAAGATA